MLDTKIVPSKYVGVQRQALDNSSGASLRVKKRRPLGNRECHLVIQSSSHPDFFRQIHALQGETKTLTDC